MENTLVVCPFNKSHVVSKLRMFYHVTKCMKNYPNTNKIRCPFDATEFIDPQDYQRHLGSCPMRKSFGVVEEALKIKHLKGHGDCTPQTYEFDPSLVTDEFGKDQNGRVHTSEEDESEDEVVLDHKNRLRRTSLAIKEACSYIPPVKSMGRGERLGFLNLGRTLPSSSNSVANNKLVPGNIVDGIYDDSENENNCSNNGSYKVVKTSDSNVSDNGDGTNYVNKMNGIVSSQNNVLNMTDTKSDIKKDNFRPGGFGRGIINGKVQTEKKCLGRGFLEKISVKDASSRSSNHLTNNDCRVNTPFEQHTSEKQIKSEQQSSDNDFNQNECHETSTIDKLNNWSDNITFSKQSPQAKKLSRAVRTSESDDNLKIYEYFDKVFPEMIRNNNLVPNNT